MQVLATLAPVILMITLGAVLRRAGFASREFFRQCNRLVYWVGIPALLFHKMATHLAPMDQVLRITLMLAGAVVGCVAIGYLLGAALRLPRPSLAAFVQGSYRGNLAYVGMPVALYAAATLGWDPAAEPLILLVLAPMVPLYNVVAVAVLLPAQHHGEADLRLRVRRLLVGIATNPMVLGPLAGVAYGLSGLPLPSTVQRTCAALGDMSLPLALLGIGAALDFSAMQRARAATLAASLLKVAAAPVIGYGVGLLLGASSMELRIALIYLATPTAALSYVMADQMGADADLAAGVVAFSTVIALPAMAVVLAIVG